uniref:Uncharacterized protein n=1 Tax=Siphoviridae sp. ctTBd21 TaxID=2825516 RepID=A0A8S5Q6X4_9CAUD|nr:MAG TPA: hypothetical protein [Siphoviridae sp. ctTBd21]
MRTLIRIHRSICLCKRNSHFPIHSKLIRNLRFYDNRGII